MSEVRGPALLTVRCRAQQRISSSSIAITSSSRLRIIRFAGTLCIGLLHIGALEEAVVDPATVDVTGKMGRAEAAPTWNAGQARTPRAMGREHHYLA